MDVLPGRYLGSQMLLHSDMANVILLLDRVPVFANVYHVIFNYSVIHLVLHISCELHCARYHSLRFLHEELRLLVPITRSESCRRQGHHTGIPYERTCNFGVKIQLKIVALQCVLFQKTKWYWATQVFRILAVVSPNLFDFQTFG
jgi:hypothetical protein